MSKVIKNQIDESEVSLYQELDSSLSTAEPRKLSVSDIIEGTVVDKRAGSLIVDVGYKSEGIVSGKELKSDSVNGKDLNVGDKVMVYVVKTEDDQGQLVLSIRRTQQASSWSFLEKAKLENSIVEAVVTESNNGGVIVALGGNIRGFIPTSQLDSSRVYVNPQKQESKDSSMGLQTRLSALIGQKINARIIELDREKNKIILSEKMRDLEKWENTLKKVKEGDVLKGEVSGITSFGVFINAEGLEGLVHVSELSWDKVEDIESMFKVGDKVDVMVIGISDAGKRVAYSIKRLQEDPWSKAISKFKVGDIVDGKVQRVADYGAFVRIADGVNGLIHISEMSDKLVKDPRDIVKEGDAVKVKILLISSTERHLGLSLKLDSKPRKKKFESQEGSSDESVSNDELAKSVDTAIEKELGENS